MPPISAVEDWRDVGEEIRSRLGIDGTAGDAQDIPHASHLEGFAFCVVCGLGENARVHRRAQS